MYKRILFLTIVLIMISSMPILALTTIHEDIEEEKISSGATRKHYKRFTDEGWLNINIISVNLDDKNTKVKLLTSENGLNTFQTTMEMATNSESIAAINGDFFGGNYQNGYTVGFSYEDENLLTSAHTGNEIKDEYASLIIDNENCAYTTFVKNEINLQSMLTGESLAIKCYNRSVDNYETHPVIFTKEWGETTLGNTPYLPQTELVVEDGTVVDIRNNGELAKIPENGFIVVAAGTSSDFINQNFKIGTRIKLSMDFNVDLSSIKTAISGGAILVKDGKIPENFSSIIYGRNPRTAVGISKDKQTIYLITVDGRQEKSIGMTQTELAEFLIEKGIDTAINLDGGGSTTMVGKKLGEENLKIFNLPSGGTYLRKVTNSLGVFHVGKKTELAGLILEVADDNVFVGCERTLVIKGYDKNSHPVSVDINDIKFETSGVSGKVENGVLKAGNDAGVITITATKGKIQTSLTMNILSAPNELEVIPKRNEIKQNENQFFQIIAKNKNGFYGTVEAENLTWKVVSGDGSFEDGKYTPKTAGLHCIEISAGNAKTYALLNVIAISERKIDYISKEAYSWIPYPAEVTGSITKESNDFLRLKYDFSKTDATRAAYIRLNEPIPLNENDIFISLPVTSKKQSSEYIKLKIIDANQETKLVMMQRGFDSDEEVILTTSLEDIAKPATLTDIYVGQDAKEILEKGTFFIGNITITSKGDRLDISEIKIPQDVKGTDISNTAPSGSASFKIAIYDGMVPEITLLDRYKNITSLSHMKENTNMIILNSSENLDNYLDADFPIITPKAYDKNTYKNVDVINLDVSSGGLRKTDYTQYFSLENDIRNSKNKNILIVMKGSLASFTDSDEKLLFINLLRDLKQNSNKNIWVISNGNYTEYSMEKRVKYLSVNNLNLNTNEPIEVAMGTEYIEISVSNDEMTYEIKRVF